jgi:hypothetical protein
VVGGQPPLQPVEPLPVAEDLQVTAGDGAHPGLGDTADLGPLVGRGEPQPGVQALLHGRVTAGAAEDEQDRRQQPLAVEPLHDVGPQRRAPAPSTTAAAPRGVPVGHLQPAQLLARVAQQLGVHVVLSCRVRVVEQVEHPPPDQHVLPQRHRPVLADHDRRLAVDGVVTGQQPDPLDAVPLHQVVVLLVGQRLDRRGVEALAPQVGRRQRQVHRELPDHGLARPGGGADEHTATPFERLAGLPLEVVEIESEVEGEVLECRETCGLDGPAARRGEPLGGAAHALNLSCRHTVTHRRADRARFGPVAPRSAPR